MAGEADHCPPSEAAEAVPAPLRPGSTHSHRWFVALGLLLSLVLVGSSFVAYLTLSERSVPQLIQGATIYYNEACSDCLVYLNDDLLPSLARSNITSVVVKDYINDRTYRAELTSLNDAMGIPFELQSHLATFVVASRTTILEGHVPGSLIEEALALDAGAPSPLLVYQDSMDVVEAYRAWGFAGAPQTYAISTSLEVYVQWFHENVGSSAPLPPSSLLPLVLVTGFLDGLNPCAFAVLLFFVSFLYAVRAPRPDVLRMGSLYAYAVLVVYFLIGLGLLRAIVVSDDPHLIAKVAAVAVIVLGSLPLLRIAFPRLPVPHMTGRAWDRIRARILAGSFPSATAAGLLVGLCTFPCSGGVYVAILGLLAANTTFLEGLAYLYLYNGMYILPLLAVLAAVSNRQVALAAARWERAHSARIRALLAAAMVGMGAILLAASL